MHLKKIIIVVALIASVCFLTYPVSAESGISTVATDVFKDYQLNLGGVYTDTTVGTFSVFKFNVANYNVVSNMTLRYPDGTMGLSFPNQSNVTTFTCQSPNICNGIVSYSVALKKISWVFASNNYIIQSPVTLVYADNIFTGVYSLGANYTNSVDVTIDQPFCFISSGVKCYAYSGGYSSPKYSLITGSAVIVYYNVTYPISGYYQFNVDKSGNTVNSEIEFYSFSNSSETYFTENFNLNNFSGAAKYLDGLYMKLSLLGGQYTVTTINLSGTSGYVPPEEPIVVDPITGVGIKVSPTSGYRGTVFNISWLRTKPTPFGYIDTIEIYESGITGWVNIISSPPDSGYSKNTFTVASYTVKFVRTYFLFGTPEVLASASFEVKPEEAEEVSYVFAPAKVAVGQLFNVTYKIGWEKSSGTTVWLRDYSWDNVTNAYSTTYQPWAMSGTKSVETNQSILVTKTGKHLLKLCDVLLGCKASTIIEAHYNGTEVTDNVSYSNITLDKTSYSYGETMLVKVAVDNLNWSEKQIVVEYYDEDEGLTQIQYYVQKQIESIPLYISDLTFSGSGSALMRLVGRNVTGDHVLATAVFTLSNVDAEGYGLAVTGGSCKGDIAQILTIVPAGETANLSISADIAKYNKNYVINGTKTISYKYPITGTYYITLRVNNEAKRLIIKNINDCDVVIIKDDKIYGGNTTATCDFWNNCVNGMFPGQGLNNVTRLLFALLCIVIVMFFGMVVSKGNFGVSVILGFIPYAFFTYLTLSSPCGEYMPVWVSIFIALIVGIKMKWFS